jgi:hypothetical protein
LKFNNHCYENEETALREGREERSPEIKYNTRTQILLETQKRTCEHQLKKMPILTAMTLKLSTRVNGAGHFPSQILMEVGWNWEECSHFAVFHVLSHLTFGFFFAFPLRRHLGARI